MTEITLAEILGFVNEQNDFDDDATLGATAASDYTTPTSVEAAKSVSQSGNAATSATQSSNATTSATQSGNMATATATTAIGNVAPPNRNVGKKYKKWASERERVKFYKKANYGPTIATRKPQGVEKIYPPIPDEGLIIEGYSISQFARIRLQNGTITTGSSGERAKIEIPFYKTFTVSRLVASSFGLLQDNNEDVDHIDFSRPLNNALSNLQTLSRSDHSKKTHVDHADLREKTKVSLAKPIVGRKLGSGEEFTWYISSREAEKATSVNSANIRTICKKRSLNDNYVYQCGGYEWKYAERNMGEVEPNDAIWKKIISEDGTETPHYISQYGLVRRGDGFITRGCQKQGRYNFGSFQVSILVALYFLPPPLDKSQTTVNHKDCNPLNNHVSNLEWASDREQIVHSLQTNPDRKKSSVTKQCKYRKEGADWTVCNSIAEASAATGVSVRSIRINFRRETFTQAGYQFKEIDVPLLPGETFVPLRLYKKVEQKERRAPRLVAMLQSKK